MICSRQSGNSASCTESHVATPGGWTMPGSLVTEPIPKRTVATGSGCTGFGERRLYGVIDA